MNSKKVVLGKSDSAFNESWLFYMGDNKKVSPISDTQGVSTYSDDQIEEILSDIEEKKKFVDGYGGEFYFFVVPNKENVYREMLPNTIDIYKDKTRVEDLYTKAQQNNMSYFIYAKPSLVEAKNKGQLYYKQDTHWNELGAYYGFKALMSKIDPGYKVADPGVEFIDRSLSSPKDLAGMSGTDEFFKDIMPVVEYLPEVNYSVTGEQNFTKVEGKIITESDDAPIKKTILVVGDSYRIAMTQFFAKTFERAIIVRGMYSRELLDEYKPDIIVYESVERYVEFVTRFEF